MKFLSYDPFVTERKIVKQERVLEKFNNHFLKQKGKLPQYGVTFEIFNEWLYGTRPVTTRSNGEAEGRKSGLIKSGDERVSRSQLEQVLLARASSQDLDPDYFKGPSSTFINKNKKLNSSEYEANKDLHYRTATMEVMQNWFWSLNKVIYKIPKELWGSSDDSINDFPTDPLRHCPQWGTFIGLDTELDPATLLSKEDIENKVSRPYGIFYNLIRMNDKDYLFVSVPNKTYFNNLRNRVVRFFFLVDLSQETIKDGLREAINVETKTVGTSIRIIDPTELIFIDSINAILFVNSEHRRQVKKKQVPESHAPAPKKTGIYKLSPRLEPVEYQVGSSFTEVDIGEGSGTTKGRKAHIRKGHWHGYWVGPKTEKQEFVLKRIPTTYVRGTFKEE